MLLNLFLIFVQLCRVGPERVPLLNHLALLLTHLFDLVRQLLVGLREQFDLAIHLVTETLVTRNVLDRLMQNRELFLQELDAVISYRLLHHDVEVGVAKGFVAGELSSELVTEVFAHLL